jgi:3-oxoacyl-[acyl-carrier-protein] synthase-3
MAVFTVPCVSVKGISACVPLNKVSNYDCELLDEKERKLFVKSTGIEYRRVADSDVTAADLCEKAANQLLVDLKWERSEINVLVFVTQTPDYITPSTAIVLQEKLQLSNNCLAFDINLGCSGYVYGLSVVASLLQNIPNGKGLLLVGDISTACISPNDKSTVPLFSDAGSATALIQDTKSKGFNFNLQSDGKGFETIIIPEGGYRNPFKVSSLKIKNIEKGIERNGTHLILNGIDVFNFSVNEVPENIQQLLTNYNSVTPDYFVLHQANKIINEGIADSLNIDLSKFPSSLKYYGNTSSASLPITLVTELLPQLKSKKLNLLLSGFGVGLSWGSVLLETEKLVIPEIIFY